MILRPVVSLTTVNLRHNPSLVVVQLHLTLQPHGLKLARLPCPSPSPWVCSNSCPLSVSETIQPSHPLPSPHSFPHFSPALRSLPKYNIWGWDTETCVFKHSSYSFMPSHIYWVPQVWEALISGGQFCRLLMMSPCINHFSSLDFGFALPMRS